MKSQRNATTLTPTLLFLQSILALTLPIRAPAADAPPQPSAATSPPSTPAAASTSSSAAATPASVTSTPSSAAAPSSATPAAAAVQLDLSDARNQKGWGLHHSEHDLMINRAYERGVVDRMLTEYNGRFEIHPSLVVSGALGTSAFSHSFVNLLGLSAALRFPHARSELTFEYQHENWSDWSMAENRLAVSFFFYPSEAFSIVFGFGYRGPVFGNPSFLGTLGIASDSPEICVLYRFQWEFLEIGRLSSYVMIWNYDRYRFFNENNVHFTLWPQVTITPALKVYANFGVGVRGVSGGILSWGASSLGLGITYEH